jgi:dolichol-phosphate mannosyltransferase
MQKNKITIVIPSYNEERNLTELWRKLNKTTEEIGSCSFHYLFIDDGSTDKTFEKIKTLADENNKIRAIKLSRNFGSHIAITAGIENSTGSDASIVISADLQEPPELIESLINKWREGFEVVWTVREKRSQSVIGKLFSKTFYKLFISGSGLKDYPKEGPSGFFLLDKKVIEQWPKFKESNRMIIGMVAWMGFKQTAVSYKQNERKSGKSSFTFKKLIKLAIDSFVSFSFAPIRFMSYLGIIISLVGFIYAIVLIFNKIFLNIGPTGWTSLMVVVLCLGGLQLIMLGVLGEYIWRGVDEARNRPLYLISDKLNFEDSITCL